MSIFPLNFYPFSDFKIYKFRTNNNNRRKTITDTHFGLILSAQKKSNRNQRIVTEYVCTHTQTDHQNWCIIYESVWWCFYFFERRLLFFILINGLLKQVKWCDSLLKQFCVSECVRTGVLVSAPLHTTLKKNDGDLKLMIRFGKFDSVGAAALGKWTPWLTRTCQKVIIKHHNAPFYVFIYLFIFLLLCQLWFGHCAVGVRNYSFRVKFSRFGVQYENYNCWLNSS